MKMSLILTEHEHFEITGDSMRGTDNFGFNVIQRENQTKKAWDEMDENLLLRVQIFWIVDRVRLLLRLL